MDFKKTNAHLTIFLFLLFAAFLSFAGGQENPLTKAIQFYEEGKFQEAEQILKNLLDEKPDHLMVNYYYGACRTENGHYGTNEIIYLLNGSLGESPLKTDYYIGVQYHAKNNWTQALRYYIQFKSNAVADLQKEVQLSEKIAQCNEKINPFILVEERAEKDVLPTAVPRENKEYDPSVTDSITAEKLMSDSTETQKTDSTALDPISGEAASKVSKKNKPVAEPINFIIDGELTYVASENFRTKKGLKYYSEGSKKKKDLEARIKKLDLLRDQYGSSSSYSEKQEIGKKILAAETENYKLQQESHNLLMSAKQEEMMYWQNAPADEKRTFTKELEEQMQSELETEDIRLDIDTTYIDPNLLLTAPEVSTQIEAENEDELIYKIQLGAYSRGLPTYVKNLFDKLSYIRKIENYTDEKGIVVYTTGNLSNYVDALKMQNQVRQEGVEDAFVVPYFNGKRITLKEAKEIEAGK